MDGKVIAESDGAGNITADYIWGPGNAIVKREAAGNKKYYYLSNGHGDVVQIADTNGKIVNSYYYDEWGNILAKVENIENPFKYAGEMYDEESGMYYLRARYYDPRVGRFISEDTNEGQVDNPLSLNLYTYCANNPIMYTDPSGHYYIVKNNDGSYSLRRDNFLSGAANFSLAVVCRKLYNHKLYS